ncbi:peptidoglycan DD-metalloendopeptidase family protein [Spartinivicinus poritis]|uniref:Peptidoglycan DD-metalloendopeptidase family protein n=1 Tax=Spartinivicinus poritis TaxID=2994640 RepID=A0ABT5U1Y5_9GAMM|nr:peptidoglycan DD-metalloendopeptidase family protein [Spartinivicinus sp. A2-2]MDE1460371.1 peptidoglycan DD-metalloendopeptidase family protein [Spartinivicinus sp. A2-2]
MSKSQNIAHFICLACLVISFVFVPGCVTTKTYAPVTDRTQRPKVTQGEHIVKPGETLYSIAWRYGWDYRKLASVNNIRSPYLIHPQQRIKLSNTSPTKKHPKKRSQKITKKQPKTSGSVTKVKKPTEKSVKKRTSKSGKITWIWPVKGRVIENFTTKGKVNKGIDIGGKLGQPVNAAADGKVVYAGSGLLGYGKLVIIKHNYQFLSAYAHNRKLLVKEGDKVQAGQKIAEIGATGTTMAKLHFEIRQNGTPVNPLKFLPR